MAIQVYINDVDKSSVVNWPSLKWNNNQNNKADIITFKISVYNGQSYAPALTDEVELYLSSTKIFGGTIIEVSRDISGGVLVGYNIKVKDYAHIMDRRLVVDNFEDVPCVNIICEILNRYINKGIRIGIADFETNEIWNGGVADTTNYRTGTQGLKLTDTNAATDTAYRDIFLDLETTGFSASTDIIEFDVWVDDVSKLGSVVLKIGDADLTNYYSYTVTGLVTGANVVRVAKSSFSSTGSPDWTNTNRQQLEVTSTASNTVNVTFDNWQVMTNKAYTRNNAMTATWIVKFAGFIYEQPSQIFKQLAKLNNWNWYVDENRDINFFAKSEKAAPFELSDTLGNHINSSVQHRGDSKQLRNSIYVRGGDYLGNTITESLDQQADSDNKIFLLGYRYKNYSLTVDSVEKSVGILNLQAFEDNVAEKQLRKGTTQLKVGSIAADEEQTQQVICSSKGRRSKVKLRIRKVGAPVDNLEVQLFSDSGNEPTGTNISDKQTLAGGSITTSFVEYTFTFAEASVGDLLLDDGDKYHIKVDRSGIVDAANYYEIDVYKDDYDGLAHAWGGASWTLQNYSWYFQELIDFEVLYSFNEKQITFETAPTAGAVIDWTADPFLPVIIQYKDYESINNFGEFEFKIIDKSIKTKEGARQRALADIQQYSEELEELKFTTYENGLRAGQTITVDLDTMGIDGDFIITKVNTRTRTNGTFVYTVTGISTRVYGILDWLQDQLESENKKITIDENEVVDKIEGIIETLPLAESWATTLYNGSVWSNDALTTPNALVWDTDIWV